MPSTIGKCKLFRIKHITLLEGETFLRNKHEIAFFEIKCTFFGRKENTISYSAVIPENFVPQLTLETRQSMGIRLSIIWAIKQILQFNRSSFRSCYFWSKLNFFRFFYCRVFSNRCNRFPNYSFPRLHFYFCIFITAISSYQQEKVYFCF